MERFEQLLSAARAVTTQVEVKFHGVPEEDQWICIVQAGDIILFESNQGSLDSVIEQATQQIGSMVQRVRSILVGSVSTEDTPTPTKPLK